MKLDFYEQEIPSVVIVEDEAIIALDLQYTLEKMGCTVARIVDSAHDAVQVIAENPPDAVLMDIMLRGKLDGIDAAQIIRETSEVPIIFATGNTDQSTISRADTISSSVFISKPIISGSLFSVLQEIFAKSRYRCTAESV